MMLGTYGVWMRCANCGMELPDKSRVEEYETFGGLWIVVECPRCQRSTPRRMEAVEMEIDA